MLYTYIIALEYVIPNSDRQKAMILKIVSVAPNKQLLLAYRAEAMQTDPVIIIQPPIKIKITA